MSQVNWDALQGLFEGALACPTEDRAAFLDQHTNGDAALRREIESLLAAHERAGGFLSTPAVGPATAGSTRLAAGTSLGAFSVLEPLGAGGMGEVYRARDTRLDRQVAIKVLSSERDTAPGARERFEREARAISRLSHPRICTIHDVGVAALDGADVPYLVMELLDGETLAARIARGPLSIEQALAYAIDIADALIAAHGQGIVHRDLKPANVMVTGTGIKLLDFGLAQLRGHGAPGASAAAVSSVSGLTSEGLVFGTLPYTSPEQLRGEKVDTRTDIFAFGAVLYEMLTGARPFAADSQAALIAAILEHDAPPVSERQPVAAANLDRIVRKCLAKHPDDRWQTARDLKSELVWIRDGREAAGAARITLRRTNGRAKRGRQIFLTGIPTAVAVAMAVLLWRAGGRTPPAVPTPARVPTPLDLNLPRGVTLDIPINGSSINIAPDGSRIAFVGVREGKLSLFIHTLQTGRTVAVPDTDQATSPIFSPDSQWLVFSHGRAVRKVPAAGGPIQLVFDGPGRQMSWLSDDRIVTGGGGQPLKQLDGQAITRLRDGEEGHHTPVLVADGSMLFTILRGSFLSSVNSVAVLPAKATDATEPREVIPHATTPRLVGNDAIVFAQGRSLLAAAFDPHAARLRSDPRALDLQVQTTRYSGAPMYAVSNNGTLLYAERAAGRRLVWIDRQGREEPFPGEERMYSHLRLSPDGRRVATYVAEDDRDLWVLDADGRRLPQQLTSGPARDAMPVWTRDGSTIFYTSGERTIYRIPSDGSKLPQLVFPLPHPQRIHPTDITADSKRLLTHWDIMPKAIDLRVLELGPKTTLTRLIGDSGGENDGRLSRDGKWIVYVSGATNAASVGQIVVRRFTDIRAEQTVISPGAGQLPIWSRDGREIFYRAADGTVMSVQVSTSPTFSYKPAVPVLTPPLTLSDAGTGPTFDVSPDGRRFLFIRAPELDIHSLKVVLNWDVDVKAAIAGKRSATQ